MPKGYEQEKLGIAKDKIDTVLYDSKTVGNKRKTLVYSPLNFDKKKKYPVLYLLHGIGSDLLEWFKGANLQNILDNLYAKGKIQPIIVVMPNDCAMKDDRSVGNIMASDKVQAFATFEKDLLDDLIPFIEKKYPALTDKDSRAIAGASPKFRGNSFYYWTYRAKNG